MTASKQRIDRRNRYFKQNPDLNTKRGTFGSPKPSHRAGKWVKRVIKRNNENVNAKVYVYLDELKN
jgi:hypothetical protein